MLSPVAEPIVVDGVARRFGRRWALAGVRLEVPASSTWMVVGPNGSGKTTLLRCLATELKPHQGAIRLGEHDLWEKRRALRPRIGMLAHQLQLWEDLSPRENLVAWGRLGALDLDADALLARVGLDAKRPDPVRALSAGMKRRLALARLLAKRPAIALLDEPFGALDPPGRILVMEVIRELHEAGATVMLATHLPRVAMQVCAHAASMEAGRVLWSGPSSDVPRVGGS